MKKLIAAVLAAAVLQTPACAVTGDGPGLSAASAILAEAESGRILYAKNAHEQRPIASITKLMTCLVAAESGLALDTPVTVKPEWVGIEGSSIYLRPDEQLTLECLLYGLMLASGNDAALAVACVCAGTQEAFVARMNERAAQLGMERTQFTNPSGLDEPGHYSTAYDMALLAGACLENETVAAIVSTKSVTLGSRTFTNHNKLLRRCEGCIGMKTGYTQASGRTLVSAVKHGDMTLIAVTLNAPDDWNDHEALYDYGFSRFSCRVLCDARLYRRVPTAGSLVPFVAVQPDEQLLYPLAEGEQVRVRFELPDQVTAPVVSGQSLGTVRFYLGDTLIGERRMTAAQPVNRDLCRDQSLSQRIRALFDDG